MVKCRCGNSQSGQIGLVVLLIGAVLMTIGIGAVSQSIIETKTAKQEEESSQAFNYAEQAVEEMLNDESALDEDGGEGDFGTTTYEVNYSSTALPKYASTVLRGHSAQVMLGGPDNMKITWKGTDCATSAELIVTLIRLDGSLTRQMFGCREAIAPTGYTIVSSSGGLFSTQVNIASYEMARVKAVYADADLVVEGFGGNLPVQGHSLDAEATIKNTGETRAVQATRMKPSVPGIFDYAIFSGTGISQSP